MHASAATDVDTDWAKVVTLYDQLYELEPTPIVALNRAVALSRWQGPHAAIHTLEELAKSSGAAKLSFVAGRSGRALETGGGFRSRRKSLSKGSQVSTALRQNVAFLESQLQTVRTRHE